MYAMFSAVASAVCVTQRFRSPFSTGRPFSPTAASDSSSVISPDSVRKRPISA
jgi:hypothetical protein